MKAKIKYSIDETQEIIDIEEFGHEPNIKWSDLSEDDKNKIRDSLIEQMIIQSVGEDYDF